MNFCRPRYLYTFLNHSQSFKLGSPVRLSKNNFSKLLICRSPIISKHLMADTSKPLTLPSSSMSIAEPTCRANLSTSAAEPPKLSKKDQLKRAFKDYGATVIIFHVGMSLCSLGVWYLIVSSGIDVNALLKKINIDESKLHLATGASTFVVAYALHKLTAPIRISITLASTPFIVAYLRRIGVLKMKNSVAPTSAKVTSECETPLNAIKKDAEKGQS